jgi:hypothetical protein
MKSSYVRPIVDTESDNYKSGYDKALQHIIKLINSGISIRNCYQKIPKFIDDDETAIRGFRDGFYEILYKISTGIIPEQLFKSLDPESVNNMKLITNRCHIR